MIIETKSELIDATIKAHMYPLKMDILRGIKYELPPEQLIKDIEDRLNQFKDNILDILIP